MKLFTYLDGEQDQLGIHTSHGGIPAAKACRAYGIDPVWTSVHDVIEGGTAAVEQLKQLADRVLADGRRDLLLDEAALTWRPCVPRPEKIICVGLNYRKHAEETGAPVPDYPILFNKFANALAGHQQEVTLPSVSERVDYEAELTIVIGKRAKDVSREEALDYVFGYCTGNDLSARDLQKRTAQWMLGKTCDGFAPIGPYVVTSDEVGNPNSLEIQTMVNGERRQHSNTADMIFHCDEIVSYISRHMTLQPGDLIMTGTPEGVIIGMPKEQRVYLQPGDVVTVEVEKLGALTTRFVAGT
ncbi:FAA hydrolase family protein [Xylanibacillus composti]|uniref:Fumarylacetoacetase-like C-terminal domain-containing protein n=1 Tax=Xylanibacillus composti TaxID=1572762 RepID=A0A8J4GZ39_9BACL|nr:fumarylacetoacetate hydrolase family protein [Xylanibacillus composti]MDT9723934.1 FAA hydrolase family protein [Xylanibacillus composti]GIQ67814.1 hypothetical protein XYCOK13_06380 [Xylanibacillus composti]